ncbi:GtrA family protein [Mesorhizobium waimense]|nr:GtrA family protein [Mesorhizobium waimense]
MRLIAMYGLFCLVATGANLGVRWLAKTLAIRTGVGVETLPFLFALVSGTAVGLVVKYLLDKRWIFQDLSRGAKMHAKKLSLYTLTSKAKMRA